MAVMAVIVAVDPFRFGVCGVVTAADDATKRPLEAPSSYLYDYYYIIKY